MFYSIHIEWIIQSLIDEIKKKNMSIDDLKHVVGFDGFDFFFFFAAVNINSTF